nr:hypothetical protein [Tanacetum cinerariifolium]
RAGRYLPRHLAGLRFRRPAGQLAGAETGGVHQDVPDRESHAAGQPERLRAGPGRRIRPQGAVLDRASDLRRTRRPHQESEEQVMLP